MLHDTDDRGTGEIPFERQPYPPFNIREGLQESIVRVNDRGHLSGGHEVPTAVYLEVLEQSHFFYDLKNFVNVTK
jgi:hypothetical protein